MHFLIDLPHLIGLYSEREGASNQIVFVRRIMVLPIQLTWPYMSAAGRKITITTLNSYDLSDLVVGQRFTKSFCHTRIVNVSLTVGNTY